MTERSRRERTIRKRVAANSGLSVGVVIRTKNRPIFLTRSLASLAGQTHANWHAVIVNDGGAPAPIREVLQSEKFREYFNSGKVQIIDHRESVGRGRAFNAGLAKLTTDMCCCLDDDDAWGPDFLRVMTERMIELKEFSTNIGGVCGRVTDVKETMLPEDLRTGLTSGKAFSKEIARHKLLDYNNAEEFISPVLYLLQQHNCLPVQLMFDREKLSEFGGFSEHREVLEDRSLLAPFLTKYRIGIARDAMSYHYVRVK